MKKIAVILLVIFALVFSGCGKGAPAENTKIKVAATIFPIYDFVRNIGGEYVEPVLIVPPGSSPHTFSPSFSDVKKITGAKVVFYNNFGLDDWVLKLAKNAGIPLETNVNEGLQDVVKAHNGNPHLWLNPEYAISQCEVIEKTLEKIDPKHKSYYEQNFEKYSNEIRREANSLKKEVDSLKSRKFIAFHPAYTYFAEFFSLEEAGVIEKVPGQKPNPKDLAEIENLIKEEHIKAIFSEPQIFSSILKTISQDTGVKILVLDPLGGTDGRKSYIELLRFDVNEICRGLK